MSVPILFALSISTHAPAGGATPTGGEVRNVSRNFYSRPCGRGDCDLLARRCRDIDFYSRPCGRGDPRIPKKRKITLYFYSRPCGRGDHGGAQSGERGRISTHAPAGGATRALTKAVRKQETISTHAPAGGATRLVAPSMSEGRFLLTPLREGRRERTGEAASAVGFLLTPLREGRPIEATA